MKRGLLFLCLLAFNIPAFGIVSISPGCKNLEIQIKAGSAGELKKAKRVLEDKAFLPVLKDAVLSVVVPDPETVGNLVQALHRVFRENKMKTSQGTCSIPAASGGK